MLKIPCLVLLPLNSYTTRTVCAHDGRRHAGCESPLRVVLCAVGAVFNFTGNHFEATDFQRLIRAHWSKLMSESMTQKDLEKVIVSNIAAALAFFSHFLLDPAEPR